jgi:hypothetical protein
MASVPHPDTVKEQLLAFYKKHKIVAWVVVAVMVITTLLGVLADFYGVFGGQDDSDFEGASDSNGINVSGDGNIVVGNVGGDLVVNQPAAGTTEQVTDADVLTTAEIKPSTSSSQPTQTTSKKELGSTGNCPLMEPYEIYNGDKYDSLKGTITLPGGRVCKGILMSGETYYNGFTLRRGTEDANALINLKGEYDKLKITIGHFDNMSVANVELLVFIGGALKDTITIDRGVAAKVYHFDLDGADSLRFSIKGTDHNTVATYATIAFVDGELTPKVHAQ